MQNFLRAVILLFFCFASLSAQALSVIRDTEAEAVMLSYLRNIFKAAGLNPQNAQVILVNDPSVNAFVAGGQTVFIHTGLLTQAQSVDDVIFVLSHETGHIAGGHITRGQGVLSQAQGAALISTILGGLVAVAGRPDAGIAVMMGGSTSAAGLFTTYRQGEESAADRTAVDIMKRLNYSMIGFENTMKTIQAQERLYAADDFSYLRTHPLTKDRINALERFVKTAKPVRADIRFDLVKAKLIGFLYESNQTLGIYQNRTDLAAQYAKAIAFYRAHRFDESQKMLDSLIAQKPDYPYFYELKAQFYLETGQIDKAVTYYRKAVSLMPNAPLMRLSLAQALMEKPSPDSAKEAVTHLKYMLARENDTPLAWQLLATAYNQTGNKQEIPYVMAEYYRTRGDLKAAKRQAKKAVETLPKGSPSYIHAQDILDLPEEKTH